MAYSPPGSQEESDAGLIAEIKLGSLTDVNLYLNDGTYPADPDARDTDNKTALMVSASNVHSSQPDITQALITKGANVELTESMYGRRALHWAATTPNAAVTQKLIDNSATLDPKDDSDLTPLMYCAILESTSTGQVLVNEGANVDLYDNATNNKTAFMHAAENDSDGMATILIDGNANIEALGNYNFTAFLWASYHNSQNFIEAVGAYVNTLAVGETRWLDTDNIVDGTEWNALWIAIYEETTDAIAGLGNIDFNLNMRDEDHPLYETALMFACRNMKSDSVTALLTAGANLTNKDDVGRTAVHVAFETEDTDTINAIIYHPDLDPDTKDLNNVTILMVAADYGLNSVISYLISQGASVLSKDASGQTALMYAAKKGYTTVLGTLLTGGASLEARDYSDNTALNHAGDLNSGGSKDAVLYLIGQGANVNASNNQYQTALMWAAKRDYTDVITSIMNNGGDATLQDTKGWTALKWAVEWGNAAAEALLETYANPDPEIVVKQGISEYISGQSGYNFDEIEIGQESETIEFTIENVGTANLDIDDITIESNLFILNTTSTATIIAPNESTSFTVKFVPEEVGTVVSPCVIESNDADEDEFSFNVIGIGVGA